MSALTTLLLFVTPLLAYPQDSIVTTFLRERAPSFEWTAWGDSYASGVGSGPYINGRRCLRYEGAYPTVLQSDPSNLLPGSGGKLNNVVCSGSKAEDVELYQFYTEDQDSGKPNWQYYPRPGSGKPTMGTLTVGGDDIDFPGILNNCIVDGFPFPLSIGFTKRTCDEQRALTWSYICENGDKDTPNSELISKIDGLIKKIVQWGQAATGSDFRLYVTGYGQFFNDKDTGCDTVTFARTANPVDDGKPHPMMTTELRQDFNLMTLTLNDAIKAAIARNSGSNVKYIDIDGLLGTGHKLCEPGIKEPDQSNPKLWFWHYPYNEPKTSDPTIDYLNSVAEANVNVLTWDVNTTLWTDYLNDFWSHVDLDQLLLTVNASDNVTTEDVWPDKIGYRAKIFHPQPAFQQAIYTEIVQQYLRDTEGSNSVTSSASAPTPTAPPPPPPPPPAYAAGTCCFHLDEWEDCEPQSTDLYANITLVDNNKSIIYQTPQQYFSNNKLGDPINDNSGTTIQGPLPNALAIAGEHKNDYIQFEYGSLSWTSKTTTGVATCKNGGWNPRSGPICNLLRPAPEDEKAENQMDCCFPC